MAKNEQPPLYMLRRGDKLIPEMQMDRDLLQRFSEHDRIKVMLHRAFPFPATLVLRLPDESCEGYRVRPLI
jgi:hypothetical protein